MVKVGVGNQSNLNPGDQIECVDFNRLSLILLSARIAIFKRVS
jgi:hypothetical protein